MSEEKKPRRDKVQLAKNIDQRWNDMLGERLVWDSLWQEIADYVIPRKAEIYQRELTPSTTREDLLYDTTAVQALTTYANGRMSYVTPSGGRWFGFEPPLHLKDDDEAKLFYAKATEIVQELLANSNYYTEAHECSFDDGAFGTSVLMCVDGEMNFLNFRCVPVGTFTCLENSEGIIDTLFIEDKMTIRQQVQEFGFDALSPNSKKEWEEYEKTGKGCNSKKSIIHAIYPRKDREHGKKDAPNMAYASVYVDISEKHTIKDSGYAEKPFVATRHLKWRGHTYGWSPGNAALPEARQLNYLGKNMDALAEIKAFPRILIPDTHEGSVDLRAGGPTYFDPGNPNAIPREWATQGDYQIGLDREKRKEEAINKIFYVDMFNMFAGIERQMTATEVAERAAEKLTQFTPAFTRMTTEYLNPLLQRVFGMCLRAGKFGPIEKLPQQIFETRNGVLGVGEPKLAYNSRVALAIKSVQANEVNRLLEILMPALQIDPTVADGFKLPQALRDSALSRGFDPDWVRSNEEIEEIQTARADAQAAAMEQQQALLQSEAAKNVGSIKSDSVAGQAIANQAG